MKIATASSIAIDPTIAIETAYRELLDQLGSRPNLLFLRSSALYESHHLLQGLHREHSSLRLHGGTSCLGSMTQQGFHTHQGYGLSLLGILDPEGSYGVGAADIGDDPRRASGQALQQALEDADRPGEVPQLVYLTAAPGCEEQVIQGIEDLLGPDVPIIGGSTADNRVMSDWQQFANGQIYTNAVVLSVIFSSSNLSFAFHSGYTPTPLTGIATRAEGRTLYEIDGQPAAEVYNHWSGGLIEPHLGSGGSVLAKTTLNPLGRVVGSVGAIPYYRLSHPDGVTPNRGLTLFSDIQTGDELTLMRGSRESLIERAGRVASAAIEAGSVESEQIHGALVVYCAGCMLTIQNDMPQVVASINSALGNQPFQGVFTFGEQGCFIGGENRHGNLMISTVIFSS